MHHNIPYLPSLDHSDDSSEYSSSGYSEDDKFDEDWTMCEEEDEENQEDEEDQEDEKDEEDDVQMNQIPVQMNQVMKVSLIMKNVITQT